MSSTTLQSSAFICRSCSTKTLRPVISSRNFTTTPTQSSQANSQIASNSPYNPRYIDIPLPPQRYAPWQPRAKGKRPTPRELFPAKNGKGNRKITPEYLALVSKEPVRRSKPGGNAAATDKAYIAWKEKLSDSRRKNIREGLLELHEQKKARDAIVAEKSAIKQERRAKILAEEDPEDVRLTTPTILSALKQKTGLPDPDREERLEAKRVAYEAWKGHKKEMQTEELHELYIRAHEFITTEAELDEAIIKAFDKQPNALEAALERDLPPNSIMIMQRFNPKSIDRFVHGTDDRVIQKLVDALTGGSKRKTVAEETEAGTDFDMLSLSRALPATGSGYHGHAAAIGSGSTGDLVDGSFSQLIDPIMEKERTPEGNSENPRE